MEQTNVKKILKVVLPLLLALIFIFGVSKPLTSTEFHKHTIESLDEKKATVLKLTAASTAASVAISAIPSDLGTPIAEKMADLSSYFLIVLCAIFLEKYLITMVGFAACVILIPLACILFSANVFWQKDMVEKLIAKLLLFAVALMIVIPASVGVSDMIEKTYKESINTTIESAQNLEEEVNEENSQDNGEKDGWWNKLTSKVTSEVTGAMNKLENMFNNFIEALAVMIVTSCVIPILVLLFFVWLVKVILGVDIDTSSFIKKKRHIHKKPEAIQ